MARPELILKGITIHSIKTTTYHDELRIQHYKVDLWLMLSVNTVGPYRLSMPSLTCTHSYKLDNIEDFNRKVAAGESHQKSNYFSFFGISIYLSY